MTRAFLLWLVLLPLAAHGQVVITARVEATGTVESVSPGRMVVKDDQGNIHSCLIQDDSEGHLALTGGVLLNFPAEVSITGTMSPEELRAGQPLQFTAEVNRSGRTRGKLSELTVTADDDAKSGITPAEEVRGNEFTSCEIVGSFVTLVKDRLAVRIPQNTFTPKTTLAFTVADDTTVKFAHHDYRKAGVGSKVKKLVAAKMSTGDTVIKELVIDATEGERGRVSQDDQLAEKYRHLSDEPSPPRQIRSAHFLLTTDISDRQARILLDKLETMVALLTEYFGRAPTALVEGYIVRDLSGWPDGVLKEPQGIAKIREGAGICFSRTLGRQRQAILYSCDDHGVVQHESTHAFCTLAFGSTGPTWLAEGVAEMGQYWKAGQLEVDVSPTVISYIQNSQPRALQNIAIPGRIDSGTWRDYAWRWALCHLLANNPNYSNRFKPLAIALMEKREGVSFAAVYGPFAPQIAFEYDQFLRQLDNGYRADLCAWPWRAKFAPLKPGKRTQATIKARYGWQATNVLLEEGVSYDIAAVGKWAVSQGGEQIDADGDRAGRGKLVGVIFNDFKLSEPFDIGTKARFKAPASGQLLVRCQDDWNQIADNDGDLTVHFRLTPEE